MNSDLVVVVVVVVVVAVVAVVVGVVGVVKVNHKGPACLVKIWGKDNILHCHESSLGTFHLFKRNKSKPSFQDYSFHLSKPLEGLVEHTLIHRRMNISHIQKSRRLFV
jgi:hypothetical protein